MAFRPLHVLGRAVDAMRRGPTVALTGTATILVAALVTGVFVAALASGERLLTAWAGEVRLSVYLAPGADLEAARAAVAAQAPGRAVEAVPAAEGLRRLAAGLGDQGKILDGVGADALPDCVEVAVPGLSLDAARELAGRLRGVPGAADVDFGTEWLERLELVLRRARVVGLALLLLLAAGTAVLVSNALGLAVYARREELEIMKLVGATDAFVAAPFLVEGLLQGLLGGGLAAGALLGLRAALLPRAAALAGVTPAVLGAEVPWGLVGALVGGAGLVGLLGSALAVRRILKG